MYVVSGLEIRKSYPFQTNLSSQMFKYYVSKNHPHNVRLYSAVWFTVYIFEKMTIEAFNCFPKRENKFESI